jgi:hypothetical protein
VTQVKLNAGALVVEIWRKMKNILYLLICLLILSCDQKSDPIPPIIPTVKAPVIELVDGYMGKLSLFPGETAEIFTNSAKDTVSSIRLMDLGGKIVFTVEGNVYQQTAPEKSYTTGFSYVHPIRFTVPELPSGLYFWENKIPVVIKDLQVKPMVVVIDTNTINAYTCSGGGNLYGQSGCGSTIYPPPSAVSFQRPLNFAVGGSALPFLKWLFFNTNYEYSVVTDFELEDLNYFHPAKLLVLPGHSEYWTRNARLNFDQFIADGGNSALFSGNTMWWQIRYSETRDQMICYRVAALDPIKDERLKTINWFQDSLNYQIIDSIGGDFNGGGGAGVVKGDQYFRGYKIMVPTSPVFKGTNLEKDQILRVAPGGGYEYDGAPIATEANGVPQIDNAKMKFYKYEMLGFDHGFRLGKDTTATFLILQKSSKSGYVINTATNLWGHSAWFNGNQQKYSGQNELEIVTKNILNSLISGNNSNLFTAPVTNEIFR